MKRKSIKQRKRIRRIQRNIKVAVTCICLALAVGAGASVLRQKDGGGKAAEIPTAVKRQIPHLSQKSITEIAGRESKMKPEETEAPDRSGFALVPGESVGVPHQTEDKIVYLTVDDGPSRNTQAVLDILDKYQIKATFFVTGVLPEYKEMIKKAYDKGHTIGLHSYTHDYASVYASVEAYFQDLDAIGQTVKEQIGYVPCFIRFPGGSSNTVSRQYAKGIMSQLSGLVLERGYQYYDWNASTDDCEADSAEGITAAAVNANENNVVLLLHDGADKHNTVKALPGIIEHYRSRGYSFRPIDKTSYIAHHDIAN